MTEYCNCKGFQDVEYDGWGYYVCKKCKKKLKLNLGDTESNPIWKI